MDLLEHLWYGQTRQRLFVPQLLAPRQDLFELFGCKVRRCHVNTNLPGSVAEPVVS